MKKTFKYFIILFALVFSFTLISCDDEHVPVISFDDTTITLTVGDSYTLSPQLTTDATVSYVSSNTEIVSVTDGVVKAEAVGEATITATCLEDTVTLTVKVNSPGYNISFEYNTLTLTIGEKYNIKVLSESSGTLTYSSSNESVATINRYGRITAVSLGVATVYVTDGVITASCEVTVKEVPEVAISYNLNYYDDAALTEKVYQTVTYRVGDSVSVPVAPAREDFVFDGWYKENTLRNRFDFENEVVMGDMVLYAKWHVASLYTISFDSSVNIDPIIYKEGTDLASVAPARPQRLGYSFLHWCLDAELTNEFNFNSSTVNHSIKLYPAWEKDPAYSVITYYVNGEIYRQELGLNGERVENITYQGENQNDFTAWVDSEGNNYNFGLIISDDVTLYAKFSLKLGQGSTSIADGEYQGRLDLVDVEIADGVVEIGIGAFADCTNIKTVVIPASVKYIPADCFKDCESLTSVTYLQSGGQYQIEGIDGRAFYGCTSLTSLNLPISLRGIGNEAFAYCSGITNVTVPANVVSVGDGAFMGCTNLSNITLPSAITTIAKNTFRGCINLSIEVPTSITAVGDYGFYNTNVTGAITTSIKEFGIYSFYNCQGLVEVNIAKEVVSVGDYAFNNCINVLELNFEKNEDGTAALKTIGEGTFGSMVKIEEVLLPEGLEGVLDNGFRYNYGAFANCTALRKVYIPSTITRYGREDGHNSAMFYNCTSLVEVELAEGLKSLGDHMFHLCTSLETITFPKSLTTLGGYIFYGCTSLEEVVIDPTTPLTSIPTQTFRFCESLTSMTLPNSIQAIYGSAFDGCTNLSRINSNEDGKFVLPTSIKLFSGTGIFKDCQALKSITIESNETSIEFDQYATSMFNGCSALEMVTFGSNVDVNRIPTSMFQDCTSLKEVILPKNLVSIERGAFSGCSALEEFTVPSSVETLGGTGLNDAGVFANCSSLRTVTFEQGSKITEIQAYTFRYCTSLQSITVPDTVESIKRYSFSYSGITTFSVNSSESKLNFIGEYAFSRCSNLTTITVYDTITTIESGALSYCSALVTLGTTAGVITFGSKITSLLGGLSSCTSATKVQLNCTSIDTLPAGFFNGANNLESINSDEVGTYVIPENITTIGPTVFRYNYKVKTIHYMGDVTYFGLYSMESCPLLTSVYIHKNVTSTTDVPSAVSCFSSIESLDNLNFKIYVPASSLTHYETNENWIANGYVKYLTAMTA